MVTIFKETVFITEVKWNLGKGALEFLIDTRQGGFLFEHHNIDKLTIPVNKLSNIPPELSRHRGWKFSKPLEIVLEANTQKFSLD